MSQAPVINYGQDEIPHLRSQNDQLWKIIEKQRVMIQNLQKDNVRLSAERDGLQDHVSSLEKEVTRKQRVASLVISPQALREIAEADDASTPTPNSDIETFNFIVPTTSPMPPPRSPYRPLKEKSDDYLKTEQQIFESESFIRAMDDMNGRSSPGSPAPGPHHPTTRRKDSAPLPSPSTRNQSPFIVPSPSKSSSSLEVRKTRQRDSMMPPARAALEHDPFMRAASPPVPFRTNTSRNAKRESTLFSTYPDDETDEATYYSTSNTASPDLLSKKQQSLIGSNLSNVSIKVVGSNIKPNDKGKEVISFILSVGSYDEDESTTRHFEEQWRVEKLYSDFLSLDSKVRQISVFMHVSLIILISS